MAVDPFRFPNALRPFGDPALIADHEQLESPLEHPEGFKGLPVKDDFFGIGHEPLVVNERAVSVQENGVLRAFGFRPPFHYSVRIREPLKDVKGSADANFAVEGHDAFWLEFVLADGEAAAVVGLYADGRREPLPRIK
jgi:hypothetical protein